MKHAIIDINKEAKAMGMSALEYRKSCEEMIELGFMKEVKDKYGCVYLKLSTPDDHINAHLDEVCSPLKLI
jgi:hypothetical protein